ncbi:hypothetical protein ACFWY9_22995 [Amycolatopsis sp. NPDC059027]|uniref:hypothetical protein n=1 Tax=unclassified Amycolatopsis TaxID=2618356 RepID=UPI00367131AF
MTELAAALEPVLHDLRTCRVQPEVREYASPHPWQEGVWLLDPDGLGQVVAVVRGQSHAEQVVELAGHVQEWAVEALWRAGESATWPECPAHPNSHPLDPRVSDGQAVWTCPRGGDPTVPIGQFPSASAG